MTNKQKPRRLPAPKIPPGLRSLPPRPAEPPADDHPYVARIVHLIEQMAADEHGSSFFRKKKKKSWRSA